MAQADDARSALTNLLALCSTDFEWRMYQKLENYEKRFVCPVTEEEIDARRSEYNDMLIEGQRTYQTLLNNARMKYGAMELTLDLTCFIDNATGEPLTVSSLLPEAGIDEAGSRVALLFSQDIMCAVMTHDMPQLADIPRKNDRALRDLYARMTYDIGIILRMPDGMPAIIYYFSTREFVVNELTEEYYAEYIAQEYLPVLQADALEKPPVRTIWAAPDPSLNDYIVFRLSDGVE